MQTIRYKLTLDEYKKIFWENYFVYKGSSFKAPRFGQFVLNAGITVFATMLIVNLLKFLDLYSVSFVPVMLIVYFLVAILASYQKCLKQYQKVVAEDKEMLMHLDTAEERIVITDDGSEIKFTIKKKDINRIVESKNFIYIVAGYPRYVLPKRAVNADQREALFSFVR